MDYCNHHKMPIEDARKTAEVGKTPTENPPIRRRQKRDKVCNFSCFLDSFNDQLNPYKESKDFPGYCEYYEHVEKTD